MNRYRVCFCNNSIRAEFIFAATAFEARCFYARKHHVSFLDVTAKLANR